MKRKTAMLFITGGLLLALSGCSAPEGIVPGGGDQKDTQQSAVGAGDDGQTSQGEEPDASGQDGAGSQSDPGNGNGSAEGGSSPSQEADSSTPTAGGIGRVTVEGKPHTWKEMTVTIPSEWEGRVVILELENGKGFTIYQKMSYDKDKGMGYLCGFIKEDAMLNMGAGERALAFTDDNHMYYLMQPTDVSYFYEDEAIRKDYLELNSLIFDLASTILIDAPGVHYNPEEYILPLSGTLKLTGDDLLNFSDNELWIARNEIYARHGRKFTNEYLKNYFASCTWYEGTASSEEFQDSVLSQVEKENLDIIKAQEEKWKEQNPYPMEYSVQKAAEVDLNGDGKKETVTYAVGEKPAIMINEVEFPLDLFGIKMKNPEKEVFYISSITEGYEYDGREIAIIDYGGNGNAVTYFFTYFQMGEDTGTLLDIGHIEGIPFKQKTGINGFPFYGRLEGVRGTKILEDASMYVGWWYDTQNKELKENLGYYRMVPDGGRLLKAELQVYEERAEDSLVRRIPAGERVFFLWTDDAEWIEVKGKSGVRGYAHVKDGLVLPGKAGVDEVFGKAGE